MVLMELLYIIIITFPLAFFLLQLLFPLLSSLTSLPKHSPHLWLHDQYIHHLFFLPSTTGSLHSLPLSFLPQSHTYVWIHTCKYRDTCGYICTCTYPCTCMHMHTHNMYTYKCILSPINANTCTNTCEHTHWHT